jgi:hypothetical protein
MRHFRIWAMLVLFVAAIFGVLYLWWDFDVRWRAHDITRHQDDIAKLLDGAGWVSPGLKGAKLYVIAQRDCSACDQFEQKEFSELQKAGVDTRVIMIAPADVNGASKSTPAERSTVAELWVNRKWSLFQAWMAASPDSWTARGVPPADGDVARSAVIEAGRALVERLAPMLKDNGVKTDDPILIWWAKDGTMEGCNCTTAPTYAGVRKDLIG